MKDKWCN